MNRKYRKNIKKQEGFTVIEIIAVVLIMAIVGVIAATRFTSTNTFNLASEVETIKTNIRYAQIRALSDAGDYTNPDYTVNNITWGIKFSENAYTLQRNGTTATTNFPGTNSSTYNFPPESKCTTGAAVKTVTFDTWGVPIDTSGFPISVSCGASSQIISITQNTGFIQ